MRGLSAVLFDMDGLLVDTEHTWGVAEARVFAELSPLAWTQADQAANVGGPLDKVGRYMLGKAGRAAEPGRAESLADRLVAEMADLLAHGADHRPGAQALLADLTGNGVPVALVSSSPRVLVDAVLSSVGGAHFRFTVAGDEVARTKPFPDPYLLACERLGVAPGSVVVLEDSPTGVAAAEAAGCVVVAVPLVVPIASAPGRHVVASLEELDTATLGSLLRAGDVVR